MLVLEGFALALSLADTGQFQSAQSVKLVVQALLRSECACATWPTDLVECVQQRCDTALLHFSR